MAPYDAIAKRDADEERITFARNLLDVSDDAISFVDDHLQWGGNAEYDGILGGSFNISLKVKNAATEERVIIRFPAPGKVHVPWRDEKVRNEVMVMNYLQEKTSIPVPRVLHWGLGEHSPMKLGPFIIMEYVEGQSLGRFLAQPNEDAGELVFLDPNIDEKTLDTIYEQLARYMLELSRLQFPLIGAISKDIDSREWSVTGRPCTYDMNEVVTVGSCHPDNFSDMAPFDRANDYFAFVAQYYEKHLTEQRNICGDSEDLASRMFVARRCFAKVVAQQNALNNKGPFSLFCDDLRPSNMLIDPETLRITAVFDFEFTNVMPAQYAQDVPWWLLLQPPAVWMRDEKMDEFKRLFEPRMQQFIRAVEKVEAEMLSFPEESRLSLAMRDSWDSGRFWFNLATRCSFDVDDFYWGFLHKDDMGEKMLSDTESSERNVFIQHKMQEIEEYLKEKEEDGRFSEDEDED